MQAIVRNLPSDAARTALRAGSAARGSSSRLLLMANSSPSGARLPRTRQLPYAMRTTDGVAAPQLRERVTHTRGRVRGSNVRAPSPTLPYAARPATRPTISSDPTPQARQLADRVGPSGRCSTLPQRLTFRNTGPKPRGFEGRRTPRRRGGRLSRSLDHVDIPEDDWSEAVCRERVVRSLAVAGANSRAAVKAAAGALGFSLAQVYRLIAAFRENPTTGSLVVTRPAPKKGAACCRATSSNGSNRPPTVLVQIGSTSTTVPAVPYHLQAQSIGFQIAGAVWP
jgi:hypothetical protein